MSNRFDRLNGATDKKEEAKNINMNNDIKIDPFEKMMSADAESRKKEATHVFRGYYLESRIADIIDEICDGKGKGAKSEFVNDVFKKYFMEKDLF